MEQRFRTSQVAKFLKVDKTTIINWINAGNLPAYQTLGGHFRVSREDLIDFIRKKEMPFPYELKSSEYKILIVDDEKNVVIAVEAILDDMGIDLEIEGARNGIEAGIKLLKFIPDLVILDVRMTGADGAEVCKIIKGEEILKDTKILVYSGFSKEGKEMLKLGADKFIEKVSKDDNLETFQTEVCKLLGVKYRRVAVKSL
jgi:excisionase family DNA binding protein